MALPKFVQRTVRGIANMPVAGPFIRGLAGGKLHMSFRWKHPIDAFYGVDTSGYVGKPEPAADKALAGKIYPYMAIQPSVIRRALKALPEVREYSFIDLGCGKGRATVIASEFPFRKIIGIEISPGLARAAQKNATIISKKYPERTKIEITRGNAVDFPVTGRKIVLFNYNSFDPELVSQLLRNIEKGLAEKIEHLFMVYHNPFAGELFDSSPAMQRWFARHLPCDPSEQGFGLKRESATIIWQSVKGGLATPHRDLDRAIIKREDDSTALA